MVKITRQVVDAQNRLLNWYNLLLCKVLSNKMQLIEKGNIYTESFPSGDCWVITAHSNPMKECSAFRHSLYGGEPTLVLRLATRSLSAWTCIISSPTPNLQSENLNLRIFPVLNALERLRKACQELWFRLLYPLETIEWPDCFVCGSAFQSVVPGAEGLGLTLGLLEMQILGPYLDHISH